MKILIKKCLGFELDFKPNNQENDVQLPKHILQRIQQDDETNRPGPSGLNVKSKKQSPSCLLEFEKNKDKKLGIPKLSFGLDLKYWGQKIEPAECVKNNFDGHQFWRAPDSEFVFLYFKTFFIKKFLLFLLA